MIDPDHELSITDQCSLLGVARSTYYYESAGESPENLALMAHIDRIYLAHPENGSRMMVRVLAREGVLINRKRVQRLMNLMGIRSLAPQKRTTIPNKAHLKYPYLLRGLLIDRPNQVWCADITYVPFTKGFFYLVAIMDWHSRKVLSWRLSNTMTSDFCVAALEEALALHGTPEIFNTDQGSQGEFNRSSQHLDHGGGNGKASRMDERTDGASTDEVARSAGSSQRSRKRVLARGSHRDHERSSGSGCRCVSSGRHTLVPASWWNAIESSCTTNRSVFVVQRARGDRDP